MLSTAAVHSVLPVTEEETAGEGRGRKLFMRGKGGRKKKNRRGRSLKNRLTISFLSVIIVPMLLLILLVGGYSRMRFSELERTLGIPFNTMHLFSSVQTVNESTAEIWERMCRKAEDDPDAFLSFDYVRSLDRELHRKMSGLVVMREGALDYTGEYAGLDSILDQLPPYGSVEEESGETGVYIGGEKKAMVKQVDLDFTDGTTGSAYIVTTAAAVLPKFRSLLLMGLVLMLIILVITAIWLTWWIYAGIATPISSLQVAAHRIADGDLDFSLEAEGDDEISELTRDFETMRCRLAEAEEEKRRYDDESRELISNISHDLKTPVTTIKGYVEGIMDGVADTPEKMDRYLRTIYSKANEMDRLINELTLYTKIGTNRIPYHFTRLNVAEYFEDCVEEISPDLEERGIRLYYENSVRRDTEIIADPEQLGKVISNIIGNSVKYIDKSSGEIRLRILDVGDFIQVEIEDNGKGIDAGDLPSIFDRFYRTDTARSSEGGSGIGLSIVKKIIEDHNGTIWATSQVGRGTTMHFVIRKFNEADVSGM